MPISITLPAARPPWSTISLTRSAVTVAVAERGAFCVVTTWEPSTSSVPQSASGTTRFGAGVISCPSTVSPVIEDAGDVAGGADRPCGDARAKVERGHRDLTAEERHGERAGVRLRARGRSRLGDDLRVGRADLHDRAVLGIRVARQDLLGRGRRGHRQRDLLGHAGLDDAHRHRSRARLRLVRRGGCDRADEGDQHGHREKRGASHRASG